MSCLVYWSFDNPLASPLVVSQRKEVTRQRESTCYLPEVLVKGVKEFQRKMTTEKSFRLLEFPSSCPVQPETNQESSLITEPLLMEVLDRD